MVQRLVWKVFLAVASCLVLVGGAHAQNDTTQQFLDGLLAETQADIDVLEDLIERSRSDPERFVVLESNGQFVGIEMDTIDQAVAVGATVLHVAVQSSPTAAQIIGERIGRSLAEKAQAATSGFSNDFSQIFSDVAGMIASKSRASITEDQIRGRINEAVSGYLKNRRLTTQNLEAALQQSRQIYEVVDLLISEMNTIDDETTVGNSGGSACQELEDDLGIHDASWTWYGIGGVGSTNYEVDGVVCRRGGFYTISETQITFFACDENWANCDSGDQFHAEVFDVVPNKDANGAYVDYYYREIDGDSAGFVKRREPAS